MEPSNSSQVREYRSGKLAVLRIAFPALVLLTFYGGVWGLFVIGESGPLPSLIFAVSSLLFGLAVRLSAVAYIIRTDETAIYLKSRLEILWGKGQTVPYNRIHTLRLLVRAGHPSSLEIIYRWPEQKMMYAVTPVPLSALEKSAELAVTLLDRTNATLKVNRGTMNDAVVLREEFEEELGLTTLSSDTHSPPSERAAIEENQS